MSSSKEKLIKQIEKLEFEKQILDKHISQHIKTLKIYDKKYQEKEEKILTLYAQIILDEKLKPY